jgi:hypothetical protein
VATERNRLDPGDHPETEVTEREAFERFAERMELTVNEYVNGNTSGDCVRRADRACRVLSALLQQMNGYLNKAVILN